MTSYTDNDKQQLRLFDSLPEVYKSDVNQSLFTMAFDRHLSKDDTSRVAGYVGEKQSNLPTDRQIQEPTPHRQAFQLTPTMYTKVGTVETALSFKNFTSQLSLMDVNVDRLPLWGDSLLFNWIPPVNIDMLVNYTDYYWKSETLLDSPQYLTIENPCNKASFKVSAYEQLIAQKYSLFSVVRLDFELNAFVIQGKVNEIFVPSYGFNTGNSNAVTLERAYWIVVSSAYDTLTNQTTVIVHQPFALYGTTPPVATFDGQWWWDTSTDILYQWSEQTLTWNVLNPTTHPIVASISVSGILPIINIDIGANSFIVEGKQDDILTNSFLFFTKFSDNVNLQNKFWTSVSSAFDTSTNTTAVIVQESIAIHSATPPTAFIVGQWWWDTTNEWLYEWTGIEWIRTSIELAYLSLYEQLQLYQQSASCIQNIGAAWDMGLWDDNQLGNILWNTQLLSDITHTTESNWIIANGPPIPMALWYDTSTDNLKQRELTNTTWVTVVGNFSSILNRTTGTVAWDASTLATTQPPNIWSLQNNWIHKTGVQSFEGLKRADMPILEYDSTMEINSWTAITYPWKYRNTTDASFELVDVSPSRLELEPIKGYVAVVISGSWYLYLFDKSKTMNKDFNYTGIFTSGYTFRIVDDSLSNKLYVVDSSEYREVVVTDPAEVQGSYMITVVKLQDLIFTSSVLGGVNNSRIIPVLTSKGDAWQGYHMHWCLDVDNISYAPTSSQSTNIYKKDDLENNGSVIAIAGNPSYLTFTPQVGTMLVGKTYQEFTADITGIQQIDLLPHLIFDPLESTVYATSTSNELRVYKNGIRQYGTYTEILDTGMPSYTSVGTGTYTNIPITYVSGISFIAPVQQNDVIKIEVCPAAFVDMGLEAVPVRTVEDETSFFSQLISGTQPVYRSLSLNHLNEQTKTSVNQYPLFNIYDLVTNDVINAAAPFEYKEDSSASINPGIQRRIATTTTNGTRDFTFLQNLVDSDNGIMYGYRNTSAVPISTYWYNGDIVKSWDGNSWAEDVVFTNTGRIVRRAVISAVEPVYGRTIEQFLWFNSTTDILYKRDINTSTWVQQMNVIISTADPTLRTIWKHGLHDEKYIPDYVDEEKNPITVGDPLGDWEVTNQWIFNPEHHNKKEVNLTQVITHFRSIINEQPPLPGLIAGGIYTQVQSEYNYGIGGTIHEHNDSFDTLISAVNLNNVTPVKIIEFAGEQYSNNVLTIEDIFKKNVVSLFGTTSTNSLLNQQQFVSDAVISNYGNNSFLVQTYNDTSAYDEQSEIGMKNWISTTPIFGLATKFNPHLNVDDTSIQLFHHDGHRSQVTLSAAESDSFARQIVALPDSQTLSGTLGLISTNSHPTTDIEFFAAYGGNIVKPGVYWYTVNTTRILYRFEPYLIASTHPLFTYNNEEISDGTKYYNTVDKAVYEKIGATWSLLTVLGAGDISPLWSVVDFTQVLGSTLLDVEKKLYQVSSSDIVYDYSTLTPTIDEQAVYLDYYEKRFLSFVKDKNIVAPLTNTQYSAINPFTWNYISSILTAPPRTDITPNMVACWEALYTNWYNTPYPHLEPWKLQNYHDKPDWWDTEYADTTLVRRWNYNHTLGIGMWNNIRLGVIPAGRNYPDGQVSSGNPTADGQSLPTYSYFSVNISDSSIPGGYLPDQILPPFYDNSSISGTLPTVRSLFTSYATQIFAPDADYIFGELGPNEWQWTVSINYQYDLAIIAFLMQPVKFLHAAFGTTYNVLDKLQIDTEFKQVYSHEDTLFHGDVYNSNVIYTAKGINQWYVNYNRYTGFDTSGEFRSMWVDWTPLLTYQFAGIVDTKTLFVDNSNFDVIDPDYNFILANNGAFKDLWVDTFNVTVLNIPPAIVQYNNQNLWKFELNNLAQIPREISYYDVQSYPIDVNGNSCTINRFFILYSETSLRRFYVSGDQTYTFSDVTNFQVTNSTTNNGTYTVSSVVYEPSLNRTRINVLEFVSTSTDDGYIDFTNVLLPWVTGDTIVLMTSKLLPYPLDTNTPYYIIRLDDRTFQLAETFNDALANIPIQLTSSGKGIHTVASVATSFGVFGGQSHTTDLWYHLTLDKNVIRTLTPPYTITGMQTLINIIDGYAEIQRETGIIHNTADSNDFDPDTGRLINWQLETERFIDWAYGLKRLRMNVNNRYEITVNVTTSELTFVDINPAWLSGTAVSITTTGSLPSPAISGVPYYVVPTAVSNIIKLSTSRNVADTSAHITFLSTGSGHIYLSNFATQLNLPSFEINPHRNNIWIDTPQGLLSNVVEGPYSDIRVQQTILDQYGRPLTSNNLNVYRQDKRNHIAIKPAIQNDVDRFFVNDPYNFIHLGGGHFFLESYEHFILFNNYTVGNNLIYDSFLGLYVKRFNMDYFEKTTYTLRPTLGGYYLQGKEFNRNIEGSAQDLQNLYDTFELSEDSTLAKHSRALLGYNGTTPYLDVLNTNSKTQFLFYRGMINSKGSLNSVNAYVNSKQFIDANIDEYWAWHVSNFGESRPRSYPEILVNSLDGTLSDIKFEFVDVAEDLNTPELIEAVNVNGFQLVHFGDDSRWHIFPEQVTEIKKPIFLDAEGSSLEVIYISPVEPVQHINLSITHWYDGNALKTFDGEQWIEVQNKLKNTGSVVYWNTDTICDDVRVVRQQVDGNFNVIDSVYFTPAVSGLSSYYVVNSEIVRFDIGAFTDIIYIYAINPSKQKNNPARLIDYKSNTIVQTFQLWHPALNYHYYLAERNIDLFKNIDPAKYSVTVNTLMSSEQPWNQQEEGRVWVDTSYLGYLPYYDSNIYPNVGDRLLNWGQLSEFGDVKVYKWVKSTVAPSEWDATARIQSADQLIPQNDKITGTARKMMFSRSRELTQGVITYGTNTTVSTSSLIFEDDDKVLVSGIVSEDIVSGTKYTVFNASLIPPYTFQLRDSLTEEIISITPPSSQVTSVLNGLQASATAVNDGDFVKMQTTGTLPTGLSTSIIYEITNVVANDDLTFVTFQLKNTITDLIVPITDEGTGIHSLTLYSTDVTITPAFTDADWITKPFLRQRILAPVMLTGPFPVTSPIINWAPDDGGMWYINDAVDLYINGVFNSSWTVEAGSLPNTFKVDTTGSGIVIQERDIIDIVRMLHILTEDELNFNPDVEDDGTTLIQWKEDYEYTQNTLVSGSQYTGFVENTYYYFWVEGSTDKDLSNPASLSLADITNSMRTIPTPYFVVQKTKDTSNTIRPYMVTSSPETDFTVPVAYRELILRNVASYISDDDRYMIRFTRDLSLRNNQPTSNIYLKNKHEEWSLFRKNQSTVLPRQLWTKLTEAVAGETLETSYNNPLTGDLILTTSVTVPAVDRVLYDQLYGTTTRYGLGDGQAFVDKTLALNTIMQYLLDPTIDFAPITIEDFLSNYTFNTSENIKTSMTVIYETFGVEHVNNIWFAVLQDALSDKYNYKDIMKTSWISLQGTKILNVGGKF